MVVIVGTWAAQRWYRQYQALHFRQRAQLHDIEEKLASLQAALRPRVTEHATRQRMRDVPYEPKSMAGRLDAISLGGRSQ